MLGAIAGSLITVTSLTFSLTIVTLQLASSQFSPRLLRTFSRDRFVQSTLALFLATFTYALTVLRTVRNQGSTGTEFVPQIAVTTALLLALASVAGLVAFLAHLVGKLRVENMMLAVRREAEKTTQRVLPKRDHSSRSSMPQRRGHGSTILAPESGFLANVDEQALLAAAVECDGVVVIDRLPGESLVASTPLGACWARDPSPNGESATIELSRRVCRCIHTASERTADQDVAYGLRQLTDVAVKALSPGINDPTTAVHALSHTSALLCELATRPLGPRRLHDRQGVLRVVLHRAALAQLLDLAITQPRRYGAADSAVLLRLLRLLSEVAWCAGPNERKVIDTELSRLKRTISAQDFDTEETHRLDAMVAEVAGAIDRRWSPGTLSA